MRAFTTSRPVRLVALGLATLFGVAPIGVAAAAGSGAMSTSIEGAPEGASGFDPRSLPGLARQAGSGPRVPVMQGITLNGSQSLSTSLAPRLQSRVLRRGQVKYEVLSLAGAQLWSATTSSGHADVAGDVLDQGGTYLWRATTAGGEVDGPYVMRVDMQRPDAQRALSYGAATVAMTTGEPIISFETDTVAAASGSVGVALSFQPSNVRRAGQTPGLPAGWRVGGGGTFQALRWLADGWVELVDEGGRVTPFHREQGGVWVPRFGRGQSWPTGQLTTLVQNGEGGDFSVTERGGAVTVFPAPGASRRVSHPSSTWSSKEPTVQQRYDAAGRLVALVDPVSKRQVTLVYNDAATSGCPVPGPTARGLSTAPRRMLCAVRAWDGSRTDLYYDSGAASGYIARVVTDAQAPGALASQTDIGWDTVGRPTRVRSVLANAGVAAGVLAGYSAANADAPELLTTLQYDARGRVTSIARPAALVSGRAVAPTRGQRTLRYGPEGTTTALAPGRQLPMMVVVAQPSTLLVTESRDSAGRITTARYDADRQVVTERTNPAGLVERWTYDSLGNVMSKVGPTASPNDASAPRVEHDYDTRPACVSVPVASQGSAENATRAKKKKKKVSCRRTVRRSVGTPRRGQRATATTVPVTGPYSEPIKGLRTTYWANPTSTGTPAGASIGPVLGGSVPGEMNLTWASSPVRPGVWSGRLEGLLVPPGTGTYSIGLGTTARMWVNNIACAPRCSVPLSKGSPVPIRIDVVSSTTGQAGLRVEWSGPDAAGAIPTTALRPGLPQATRTRAVDDLGSGGLRGLETAQAFDPFDPSRVLRTVSPSGMTGEVGYEPYDPSAGKFARAVSGTTSPGRLAQTTYYGATETAAADGCPAPGPGAVQGGLAKEFALPGPAASRLRTRQVYDAGGRLLAQYHSGVVTNCLTYDPAGNVSTAWVPADGESPAVTTTAIVAVRGNPFISGMRSSAAGETLDTETMVDLLGRVVSSRDAMGTVTTTAYDAFDNPVEASARTAAGQTVSITNDISADLTLARTLRDGAVVGSYRYDEAGRLVGASYANGATVSITYDANGYPSVRTITAGGVTMTDRQTLAGSGRILRRSIAGPGTAAEWSYRYDLDSRLIGARLAGTVPQGVATGNWSYVLDQASQRTSITAPSTGTRTFSYDAGGRMTATSDPAFAGGFEYDAFGRATKAGPLSLAYAATGAPRRISDGTTTVESITKAGVAIGEAVTTLEEGAAVTRRAFASALGLALDADGRILTQSLALPGGVQVRFPAPGEQEEADWAYLDSHGSTAWQASGSAAPSTTILYDPDGNRLTPGTPQPSGIDPARPNDGWQAGDGLSTSPLSTPTVQMGLRTYVPRLGVYLQPDPTPGGSANDYGYAAADPINARDPSGNTPEWASIVIASAVATVAGAVIAAAASKYIALKVGAYLTAKAVGATKVAAVQGAIVGGLAGSGGDLAGQLAIKGTDNMDEIDWKNVLFSGLAGAASGGAGEWYAKRTEVKLLAAGKGVNQADEVADLGGTVNQGRDVRNPRIQTEVQTDSTVTKSVVTQTAKKQMVTMDAQQTDFEVGVMAKNLDTGGFVSVDSSLSDFSVLPTKQEKGFSYFPSREKKKR